jgi:MerR family transcriptional regulator, redox-sensitive transcriptional activator SoxR
MTAEAGLAIGEVARRAGVRASALRYYESVGLLKAPRRAGGRRVYGDEVFDTLRIVRLARAAGFSLVEIRRLLHGFEQGTPASQRWRSLAEGKLRDVAVQIEHARRMQALLEALLSCECGELVDCVRPQLVRMARTTRAR